MRQRQEIQALPRQAELNLAAGPVGPAAHPEWHHVVESLSWR
ncbi:MAG: hypothetical protein PHO55_13600 [Thiomonas arsenitoxydans]|nr:hypothetical protein [Thiomonas arsenitoxydans]